MGSRKPNQQERNSVEVLTIVDDLCAVDMIQLTLELGWPEARLIKAQTSSDAIALIESISPKVIVLDVGIPNTNGFEVLKEIRLSSRLPILVLAPDDEETTIVKIFAWGANGCLVKPFRQMEFLARIKSLSRNCRITHPGRPFDQGKIQLWDSGLKGDPSYKKSTGIIEQEKNIVGQCPNCSSILIYQEGCFTCPVCGFTKS